MIRPRRKTRGRRGSRVLVGALVGLGAALVVLFVPFRLVRYLAASSVVVVALSWLYTRIAVSSLLVRRPEAVIRGHKLEPIPVTLVVENRGILGMAYATVRDVVGRLSSRGMGQFLVSLPGGAQQVLTHDVVAQKMGDYAIGPVEVSGWDPLGFFPWRRTFDVPGRLIVHPNVYPVQTTNTRGLPAGNRPAENRMYEDVTQFRSIREYVAGDEMKRINWKVTARLGKLFSMDFQPTLYFPLIIVLNQSAGDYPLRHRDQLLERAAEVAASLIVYYVGLKQEVGLVSTGTLGDPETFPVAEIKAGYPHALGLLEILSCAGTREGTADYQRVLFESGTRAPIGTRVQVVGPPLTDTQSQALGRALRRSLAVDHFEITSSDAPFERVPAPDIRRYAVAQYGERLLNG